MPFDIEWRLDYHCKSTPFNISNWTLQLNILLSCRIYPYFGTMSCDLSAHWSLLWVPKESPSWSLGVCEEEEDLGSSFLILNENSLRYADKDGELVLESSQEELRSELNILRQFVKLGMIRSSTPNRSNMYYVILVHYWAVRWPFCFGSDQLSLDALDFGHLAVSL